MRRLQATGRFEDFQLTALTDSPAEFWHPGGHSAGHLPARRFGGALSFARLGLALMLPLLRLDFVTFQSHALIKSCIELEESRDFIKSFR
jgi:hypothetical protein